MGRPRKEYWGNKIIWLGYIAYNVFSRIWTIKTFCLNFSLHVEDWNPGAFSELAVISTSADETNCQHVFFSKFFTTRMWIFNLPAKSLWLSHAQFSTKYRTTLICNCHSNQRAFYLYGITQQTQYGLCLLSGLPKITQLKQLWN